MGPTINNYTSEVYILLRDKDTGEEHKIPISSIPVIEDITTQPDNDVVFKATWPGRGISRDTMNDIRTRISQVLSDFIKNTAIVFHTDDVFRMGCTCINYASFGIRSDDSRVLHLAKRVLAEQVRVRIAPIFDPTVQAEQVHKALETCANNPDDDRCKQCPYGCLYNCSPAYQEALDYINKLEYDIAAKKLAMNSVYGKDAVLKTVADKPNYITQVQWYKELSKINCGELTANSGVQGAKQVPKKVKTFEIRTLQPEEWVGFEVEWIGIDDDIMAERLNDVINWFVWADNFHVYNHQLCHDFVNKHALRIYFQVGDIDTRRHILDNFDAVVKEAIKEV